MSSARLAELEAEVADLSRRLTAALIAVEVLRERLDGPRLTEAQAREALGAAIMGASSPRGTHS